MKGALSLKSFTIFANFEDARSHKKDLKKTVHLALQNFLNKSCPHFFPSYLERNEYSDMFQPEEQYSIPRRLLTWSNIMKPQDSKSTIDTPSPRQEEVPINESQESSLAHLEIKSAQSAGLPFSPTKLQDIITTLEKDISSGSWLIADYEDIDLQMMPALIKQANCKYPEMHLKFALTAHDFTRLLKETIENGIQSSRYIINTQERGNHFAVIDHQTIENNVSVILFESTTFTHNISASLLGLRTRQAIEAFPLSECHFSVAEMDIQRSPSECGIFSLALAKKLYLEAHKLTRMHQDNIRGVLCEPNTPLPSEKLDTYLPASFYKHTQGKRRLEHYIKSNPSAEYEKVNKRGETLAKRFERNLVTPEDKTLSVSPHRKRIKDYKSVLQR